MLHIHIVLYNYSIQQQNIDRSSTKRNNQSLHSNRGSVVHRQTGQILALQPGHAERRVVGRSEIRGLFNPGQVFVATCRQDGILGRYTLVMLSETRVILRLLSNLDKNMTETNTLDYD